MVRPSKLNCIEFRPPTRISQSAIHPERTKCALIYCEIMAMVPMASPVHHPHPSTGLHLFRRDKYKRSGISELISTRATFSQVHELRRAHQAYSTATSSINIPYIYIHYSYRYRTDRSYIILCGGIGMLRYYIYLW